MPSTSRIKQWLNPSPSRARQLKFLALILGGLLTLFLAALVIHRGFLPIIAWIFPSLRQPLWDLAVYGAYPTQKYVSFPLRSPETNVVRWEDSCNEGLVLVSPFGPAVPNDGPLILDARGNLVWTAKDFGTALNFRMQKWQGKNHLTFWAGKKSGSVGTGAYFILDDTYNVVKKVHAVGKDLHGDLHEFEITDDGTALITIYTPRQVDMRAMGHWRPENGWIMDSMFQEIDIETGDLRFEWRASDHYRPEETFYANPIAGYWESHPFDFYHINSIQKDSLGNFLICSRHLHTVSYINGSTGALEWTLGGAYHDFEDLSEGHASDFRWQHHAHWFSEEERILSLFDNQAAGPLHEDAAYSKGVLIQLDLENMTARHLQSYISVGQTRAASQGSVSLLEPNDHVFVGWGSSAAYTEFDIAGEALCEVHLAAESTYWWERVKSYRAYKVFDWVGKPDHPPSAVVKGDKVYVSWNGATEVHTWELQGSDAVEGGGETVEWELVAFAEKDGFEGVFDLPSGPKDKSYRRYRVAALDGEKAYIGYSEPAGTIGGGAGFFAIVFGILVAAVCLTLLWFLLKVWIRRRHGRHGRVSFSSPTVGPWELGSLGRVFGRGKDYEYSKLPE